MSSSALKEETSHCSTLNVSHSDILLDLKEQRYEGLPDMLMFNCVVTTGILLFLFVIPDQIGNFHSLHHYTSHVVTSGRELKSLFRLIASKDWIFFRENVFLSGFGSEAYHLLAFQRYLLIALFLMTGMNVGVILPVNILWGDINLPGIFSASTLGNLKPRSPVIWAHILVGNLHTLIVMITMGRFLRRFQQDSSSLLSPPGEEGNTNKLLLKGLPHAMREEESVRAWVKDKYPWARLGYVSFVYEIRKIQKLKVRLDRVERILSQATEEDRVFGKCRMKDGGDAVSFYEGTKNDLMEKILQERKKVIMREPLDWAFVEFKRMDDAKFILDCENNDELKERKFRVIYSPPEDDIEWSNFHSGLGAFMREIFVNLGLFLTFIFFTTPQIVMGNLKDITTMISHKKDIKVPSLVETYIPILMTQVIGKASIFFVLLSTRLLGYITQTEINQKILARGSIYLLLIVLILPAFGSLSIEGLLQLYWNLFIQGTIANDQNKSRWECIFLPNSGLFFIDYLLTSAFLGNVFQLYKVKKLLKLLKDVLVSHSWLEVRVRSAEGIGKVWFGQQYAYFIVQFFIGAALGVSCPWVTAFALLFMVIRHFVDIDNYQRPHKATKVGHYFYHVLVFVAIGGTLFQQFFTTLFLIIKSHGEEHFLEAEMFSAIFFLISTFVSVCEFSSGWTFPIPLMKLCGKY